MQHYTCSDAEFNSIQDITVQLGFKNKYKIPRDNWVQKVGSQCYVKFMYDAKLTDMWILGLNFFRDYYVEFSKEGSSNYISLWDVPANKKNHNSHVVANYTTLKDKLIDNTLDKKYQQTQSNCKGVFDLKTGICTPAEAKQMQQMQIILI